jgi:hypothetical protein
MKTIRKMSRLWLILVVPILVLVCILISIRIVNTMDYHHNDNDFFTFWLAGHLVSRGDSPYDTSAWVAGYHQNDIDIIANPTFLYPLPLAMLLVPLGLLPFHSAYIVWVTLLQLFLLASLAGLLVLQKSTREKLLFIPLLAGLALFRPTILTLTQGQVIGFLLLVLVGLVVCFEKGKWGWGGFLLGLLFLKPNLGIFIILLVGIWLITKKQVKALVGMVSSAALLLIAGLIFDPGWVGEYLQVGGTKLAQTFGASPTVWGLSALVCRVDMSCTRLAGGIIVFLLVTFTIWTLLYKRDLSPLKVLGLVVTVTLVIAPYTWTYDQVLLLIPITWMTLNLDGKGWRFILAVSFFLLLDLLILVLLIFDTMWGIEILNAVIPLILLVMVTWQIMTNRTRLPHPG